MHSLRSLIGALSFLCLFSNTKTECFKAATEYSDKVLKVEASAIAYKDNCDFYTVVMQDKSGAYFTVDVSLSDYTCLRDTYNTVALREEITENVRAMLKDKECSVIVMFPEVNMCICSVKLANGSTVTRDDVLNLVECLKESPTRTTLTCEFVNKDDICLFEQLSVNWCDVGGDYETYNSLCSLHSMLSIPVYHAEFYDVDEEIDTWLSK